MITSIKIAPECSEVVFPENYQMRVDFNGMRIAFTCAEESHKRWHQLGNKKLAELLVAGMIMCSKSWQIENGLANFGLKGSITSQDL